MATLSDRVNTATRSAHTKLNRLIIARLPLVLPPHAPDPALYTASLFHVSAIYRTFENLWENLTDSPGEGQRKACASPSWLSYLWLGPLLRTRALRADLEKLSTLSGREVEEKIDDLSHSGAVSELLSHIEESISKHPHVLLAYAWIFYMALFSGGRYIRATLQRAGPEFWSTPIPQPHLLLDRQLQTAVPRDCQKQEGLENLSMAEIMTAVSPTSIPRCKEGLQFFHFPGSEDGEDIKREFKARFADIERSLTESQKEDVVHEARDIFAFLIRMLEELDLRHDSQDPGARVQEMRKQKETSGWKGMSLGPLLLPWPWSWAWSWSWKWSE